MTATLAATPTVLRAYRASTYMAGGIVAHVGRRPRGMAAQWAGRSLVLLSACNPGGRRMPGGWNRRMMVRLVQALRRFEHVTGVGRLGRWSEPLAMAAMPAAVGLTLARRYRQNAVILLNGSRPARLVMLAG